MELLNGFVTVFTSGGIVFVILGALLGIILGALPGLTSTMALAILAPLTFGFDTLLALCMLMGVYIAGIAGGAVPAIALNMPGTPASAATAIDGYRLFKEGNQSNTLKMSFLVSGLGVIFSGIILVTLAPLIAQFGLLFSAPEYFALGMLGVTIIISISGKYMIRGIIAALIGFAIAFIGTDPTSGIPRFTFGMYELNGGISYIPALIGLFGLSEVFHFTENTIKSRDISQQQNKQMNNWKRFIPTFFRSSTIGTFIGSIPGAGADIASWTSYDVAQKFAKKGDKYGRGEMKGVIASESANNANVGGALIPMMTFGIPGDGQTAMLIAFLLIHGLDPGPLIFENQSTLVWAMFASVFLASLLVIIYGLSLSTLIIKIVNQPLMFIYPAVIMFCLVGAFAINNNIFDVYVMFCFGVLGFLMKKTEFPIPPLMLALILAPMIEKNLMRGLLIENGNFLMFFARPLFLTIMGIGIVMLIITLVLRKKTPQEV
ncbi:tripartite tricarboxylate transporter permease [Salibacterium aidingense]|uniref:tripartite tricarboxylate transporter permease n=1 Tax=Salibacterium aidingense TaxID=384933 RepID=UPI000414FCD1|nr:tripartite tricarboxylate transporter permease [Salibacterium aidingense]